MRKFLRIACIAASLTGDVGYAANELHCQANVIVEISLEGHNPHQDPFNKVTVDVAFTDPGGKTLRVPAFWDGANIWKARYASPTVGTHRYRSECSDASDSGLNGVTGTVQITAYTGENALYRHGPVRVADDHRYLQYADGAPFFWLGDTWWMGLCHRLRWPEEFKALAADRKKKGFNVIQIVAGLYPDMFPFDPRGANEAGFPWEADYSRIRPQYFDAADRRIEYLVSEGFTPCIVGAWGYYVSWMGVEKVKKHWRYLIARYGASPVVWCAAGEANLPWYLAKGFPYDDRKQVAEWTEVMQYIRKTDPYHRPLTIHPTGIGRLSARNATDDPALLDIDLLQTPHGQRPAVEPTVSNVQQSYAAKPTMPVIDGEAAYEMLNDSLPTKWTRQMFWLCLTNGAAGHTYGANGIWQCNRPGQPHGPSPYQQGGIGYGKIPWNEAMNLPGSTQVGLGKKLFEQFAWYEFAPHPEWAAYAAHVGEGPEWGQWIWFPEGKPAKDAPVAKRWFRKLFELPDRHERRKAALWISADDRFEAYVNGRRIGEHSGTGTIKVFDVSDKLKPGRNVIAIVAENAPAAVHANPAGLLASLHVDGSDGDIFTIRTDKTWRSAKTATDGDQWTSLDFDDSRWAAAQELGRYGCRPWGVLSSLASYGPYAVGIPDKVRIIYAPQSLPVRVCRLERATIYQARAFDPTTGAMTKLAISHSGDRFSFTVDKPKQITSDDWVVVVGRK